LIRRQTVNVHVARLIYDARTKAGLTQEQLAERIGTKQPVIARLEDADYEGHSLTMLQRIADALALALDIRFLPKRHAANTSLL
jgi:transcriptional regulator with XRE-family HTH domain